jgi:hypothetical protein
VVSPGFRFHPVRYILLASLLALGVLAAVWSAPSGPAEAQSGTAVARAEAYLSQNAHAMGLRSDLRDLRLRPPHEPDRRPRPLPADDQRRSVFGATVSVSLPKNGGDNRLGPEPLRSVGSEPGHSGARRARRGSCERRGRHRGAGRA